MYQHRTEVERSARLTLLVLLLFATLAGAALVWGASSGLASLGASFDGPRVLDCQLARDTASGAVVQTGCQR